MAKQKLKSPIKDRPLRNPGESLDKQIIGIRDNEVTDCLLLSAFSIFWACIEWIHWYNKSPPMPWLISSIALIVVVYSTVKLFRIRKKLNALKQGRDGEKAVGQYLENLREQGAKVFHDIPGDNFNLDHVVICKSGIYVIETKTYSKPDKGETKALFNGETLSFNGKNETNKPIIQVKAASSWLKDLIEQSTGHKFMVKPVIVFPGWFIETTYEAKASDVWVLNPKGLPTFISNSKEQLSNEQVKLVAFNLSRYVRNFEEKK
jgi:Nuclease-related domain